MKRTFPRSAANQRARRMVGKVKRKYHNWRLYRSVLALCWYSVRRWG